MRKILFLLVAACCMFSCSKRNELIIEGDFSNMSNGKVRLSVITEDNRILLDSTTLHDGHFCFTVQGKDDIEKARLSSPMLYQLILSYDNTLTTLAQGGDHIIIKADARNMAGTYQVQGSEEAVLMGQLDSALATFVHPTEALYAVYQENLDNDSVRAAIEQDYVTLLKKHKDFLNQFIKSHPDKMSSYVAFYQSYNRHSFFSEDEDFELLKSITESLLKKYPNHPYLKKMQQRVEVLDLIKQKE